MDPKQLSELIIATDEAWLSRGGNRDICDEEKVTSAFAFVSVVSISDIKPGDILNENNIWVKRPSGGDFTAEDYDSLFGKVAKQFIASNKQLKISDIE